jgi:hypothetical protein
MMRSPDWQGIRKPAARAALWSLIACLPYWTIYLHHFVAGVNQPTGFIRLDMAYYSANGREIWERGDGLAYCNPYDNDPCSPVIYVHWLQWILGAVPVGLGLDPGLWAAAVTAVAGWCMARITWSLVAAVLPHRRCHAGCYLFTMWGGGFLVLAQLIRNGWAVRPLFNQILEYDPGYGWWFLCWGRNVVFPTEAVYHALVAAAWLAVVRGHSWSAVAAIGALAATHPFSGVEHLAILFAWLALESLDDSAARRPLAAVTGIGAIFLAYYFLYLPRFPAYRAVHADWSLAWVLPLPSLLLAYAPVAAIAAVRLVIGPQPPPRHVRFFLLAAAIALVLVKHEWFMPSRQPLHFTRGYVWMPLCLIGLPVVQRWLSWAASVRPAWRGGLAFGCVAALTLLDNTAWLVSQWYTLPEQHQDVRVSRAMRDIYRHLDAQKLTGTILIVKPPGDHWEDYNYLAATYTATTPLLGHPFLTPHFARRCEEVAEWERTGRLAGSLNEVDLLVVPRAGLARDPPLDEHLWEPLHANDALVVLRRVRLPGMDAGR